MFYHPEIFEKNLYDRIGTSLKKATKKQNDCDPAGQEDGKMAFLIGVPAVEVMVPAPLALAMHHIRYTLHSAKGRMWATFGRPCFI